MNCDNKYILHKIQIYKPVITFHRISFRFTSNGFCHIKKAILCSKRWLRGKRYNFIRQNP